MPKNIQILFRGKKYNSISDLAETFGIKRKTLYARMQKGMSLEEAIDLGTSSKNIQYNGKNYHSLLELTNDQNIHRGTVHRWQRLGYSLEGAIKKAKESKTVQESDQTRNTNPLTFCGKVYSSLAELCNEYQIDSVIVRKRLKRGWTLEDSISKPIQVHKTKKAYTLRGVSYPTQRELSEHFGISLALAKNFSKRIFKTDIITTLNYLISFLERYEGNRPALISKIPVVIYNGKWFGTVKEFCEAIGISQRKLIDYMRLNKNKDYFEALSNMMQATTSYWYDNETGERMKLEDLKNKYHVWETKLLENGFARKEVGRAYPYLHFNPTGYCATPLEDFHKYTSEIK